MILTFPEWYTRAFDAILQIFHALNRNKSIAPLHKFEYNFVTACDGLSQTCGPSVLYPSRLSSREIYP